MPGKSTKDDGQKLPVVKNFCEHCKVRYCSTADGALFETHKQENEWLGCDLKCDYWIHARCAGIIVGDRVPSTIPFQCPNH